ncbi:MAG: FHA domain-containing protein [Bdellovibrionales bacterium]|nr:FHA domain-containing protein [Bdellovibrionales bacterium]
MIRLTVLYDAKPVQEFEQGEGPREITIGRAPGCLVRLDEATVSRLHAVIRHAGGRWVLERKASFGAVRVNGEEVENAPLQGGEEIAIGKFVIRVALEEGAPVPEGFDAGDGGERTRVLGAGTAGVFRFPPGTANVAQFPLEIGKAVFGRATSCDVVLLEKKASRRHFEVARRGLNFVLKDLNSANGTRVNGEKAQGEIQLNTGDTITAADAEFTFSVENPAFFQNEQAFLPVAQEEPMDLAALAAEAPPQGVGQAAEPEFRPEPETKSVIVKLWRWYKAQPQFRRYIILLMVIAGVLWLFEDQVPKRMGKPGAGQTRQLKVGPDGRPLKIFENLSKEKQEAIQKAYDDLMDANARKDYIRVLEKVTLITGYLDDYKETRFIEGIARKAIEKAEADERARQLNERKQLIREQVAALEEKGRALYEKALKEKAIRPQLNEVIQEIYSKDPNNRLAPDWTAGIKERDREERREQEEAAKKEAERKKAEAAFLRVERIFQSGRYVDALAEADKLKGFQEEEYLARVEKLKADVRAKMASLIDPLIGEAERLRRDGGDLVKAKELYLKVFDVDPDHEGAIRGLNLIRETLHQQAKRFYAEAILAESVSDLVEAKEKFEKCERSAPEGDMYKQRCKAKMLRFQAFPEMQDGG